jgi:hypothetical protein
MQVLIDYCLPGTFQLEFPIVNGRTLLAIKIQISLLCNLVVWKWGSHLRDVFTNLLPPSLTNNYDLPIYWDLFINSLVKTGIKFAGGPRVFE